MNESTLAAAQRGDRAAQAVLLSSLQDRLYRVCLSLLGNTDDARDATQEAALRLLRQLPGFRGDSRLETWAIGIALNVVREVRRQRRPPQTGKLGPAPQAAPDEQAQAQDQRRHLRRLLDDLPPRQREALVLRFFEELSVDQTALAMTCSPGTVKATVHQALRSLRRKLVQWT